MTDIPSSPALAATTTAAPRPVLSVFDAVMIITGIVIGGGIFAFRRLWRG